MTCKRPTEEGVSCACRIGESNRIVIVVATGVRACICAAIHRVGNIVLNDIPFCHERGIFIELASTACNLGVTQVPTGEGMSCPFGNRQRKFSVIRYGNGNRIASSTIGIKCNRRRDSLPISDISLFTG